MKTRIWNLHSLPKAFMALMAFALIMLVMAPAHGKRITDAQKQDLLVEVREGLLEHRQENQGRLRLDRMKPDVMEFVWEFYYEDMVATKEEILSFQREFDQLVANQAGMSDEQKEAAIFKIFNDLVDRVNSTPLQCIEEGASCNQWLCCDGLVCADKPGRMLPTPKNRCVATQAKCQQDSECCSGYCEENLLTKEKTCRAQKVCFRPVPLNKSCMESPVCAEGSCEQINAGTLGIGECNSVGESCKSEGECCSGKCSGGKCATNYMCRDCVQQGQVPARGRSCCEGLMQDHRTKRCVIDLPPFMSQSETTVPKSLGSVVGSLINLVLPSAHAEGGVQAFFRQGETSIEYVNEQNLVEGERSVDEVRRLLESDQVNEYDLIRDGGTIRDGQEQHARDNESAMAMAQMLNRSGGQNFDLQRGSNFETCEMNLKADYYNQAADQRINRQVSIYDLQVSLLAFEYVALGAGVQDLWKVNGGENIHTSLKQLAQRNQTERREIIEDVVERNERRMTCLCLDTHGYPNLSSTQQAYFQENCPDQHAAYLQMEDRAKELGQQVASIEGASGIKYKEMMVAWYEARKDFETELFIVTTNLADEMRAISSWAQNNDWFEVEVRKYPLFNFTIRNYTGQVMFGTALATALVTAGVIAMTGGFAATATLSAWAAAGIISAAAASGSLGVWFIGSLKGAWESQAPLVHDEYVKGRENYKCGKKDRCSDFTRVLNQPWNPVCRKHISANACIRSFLVTENAQGDTRYLIDPWVPKGVATNLVIRDNREYANLLEQGFLQARRYLSGNSPAEIAEIRDDMKCTMEMVYNPQTRREEEQEVCETISVRNVIHASGFRPPSYLQETFVDEVAVSQFLPRLRADENSYRVTERMKQAIMKGAKDYVIEEGFFLPSQTENLNKFAQYVWEYHYLFPRLSKSDSISYPTPGLVTYLNLVDQALDQISEQTHDSRENTEKIYRAALQDLNITRQGLSRANQLQVSSGDELARNASANAEARDGVINASGIGADSFGNSRFFQGSMADGLTQTGVGSDNLDPGALAARAQRLQSAIATRNRINQEKQEDFDNWKKQVGDTDRGQRILAAQNDLMNGFLNPSAYGSEGAGLASTGPVANDMARGDLRDASAASRGAIGDTNRAIETRSLPSDNRNPLMGAGDLGQSSGTVSGSGGFSAADADRMREAIAARDRMGSDAFNSNEGDSIWEMVTNTYIRMYDRLLPSRNDLRDLQD